MPSYENGSTESNERKKKYSHRATRFRFKDTSKRESRERRKSPEDSAVNEKFKQIPHCSTDDSGIRRRRKRHSSKKQEFSDDSKLYDNTCPPSYPKDEKLDPEIAFRESLFDAMRDDEGAQFWEAVYGQPIHTYSNIKPSPSGELERMTDDEYATYVRTKMYEKTHQYLVEEKARRDTARKERERLCQEDTKKWRESESLRQKIEESIRKGKERASRRAWLEKWNSYVDRWDILEKGNSDKIKLGSIPWPVPSGKHKDINEDEIKEFFSCAPSGGKIDEGQLAKILKMERVRWHPDKIQQKLGGQSVDEEILRSVTSVFQTIDNLWSRVREINS